MTVPTLSYSIIVPTYRRKDVLALCLDHLTKLDYPRDAFEVRVYDNGAPEISDEIVAGFVGRIQVTYTLNEPGHGLGYSLRRGVRESRGQKIVELNDDALIPADFLQNLDRVFRSDPQIGIVGVRAVEKGYARNGTGIGRIDTSNCYVIGNFNQLNEAAIEVEHVYGFCYAYIRRLIEAGGGHDAILLAQDYSSGNRIETDQCLTARKLGFKVVYDGRIAVEHLAKPRGDMSERSPRWRINEIRNTLYLFLKHFGFFGRSFLASRYLLTHDLGIISAIRQPNPKNLHYVWTGLVARWSALAHYTLHLFGGNRRFDGIGVEK